jgi:triphosphatase
MPVEIELKLSLSLKHSERLLHLPLLESLSNCGPRTHNLYSIYYDTPDFYFQDHGIAFRMRQSGSRWIQTVKDKGRISGGLFQHREWEALVHTEQPDYTRITEPELKKLFSDATFTRQIQPIFFTQFTRTTYLLHLEDGSKIEFSLDRGKISADQSSLPLCEVELELKSGNAVQLFHFALALKKVFPFPLRLENTSKAERGYILKSGRKNLPVKASRIPLNADMCVKTALQTICWICLAHSSRNENGLLKEQSFECLYQMHAAARKQRYTLKILSKIYCEEAVVTLIRELKWLTAQFSPALEWDIFVATTLQPIQDSYPDHAGIRMLIKACKQLRNHHFKIARRAVKSKRYLTIMLTLGAWLSADSSAAGQLKTKKSSVLPGTDINKLAGAVLNEQHLQLKKYGKTLMGITPTNLHSLKIIAIKQCSATEIFADLYPDNNSNQYLRVLHKLQDILCVMDDSTGFKEFLKKVKMTKKKRLQNEAFGIVSGWAMHQCLQSRPELNHTWRSFNRITPFWLS